MKRITKPALLALAMASALCTASTPAFAWGCIAVSDEGSYGYSYSYNGEDSAREKALNECAKHTTEDSNCEITECDEDS
jgi:hypothetical protein